jgi:hypothetical protein
MKSRGLSAFDENSLKLAGVPLGMQLTHSNQAATAISQIKFLA